jgi:hypothetical protein
MKIWADCYNPHLWNKQGTHWKGLGVYGGSSYEQGAFELNILRCSSLLHWLNIELYHVYNYLPKADKNLQGKKCPNGVFAVHYWKGNRDHIKDHWPKTKNTDTQN